VKRVLPQILVVDDEQACLAALQRSLRQRDRTWQVTAMNDPRRALDFARAQPVDVVVSDMMMPGLNGLELLSEIKREAPDTVGMILTGSARLDTALDAINRLQIFRYLEKPCPPEVLSLGIEQAIEHRVNLDSAKDIGFVDHNKTDVTRDQLLSAMDHFVVGLAIVDGGGLVNYSNKGAEALLSRKDGLFCSPNGTLRAHDKGSNRALYDAIEAVGESGAPAGMSRKMISIRRPSGLRELTACITALAGHHEHVAVFLWDPEIGRNPPVSLLTELFNLTPTEAKIVSRLVAGVSLSDAADFAGVTTNTARTYLKSVFLKTDTTRQADLVGLMLASAVGMQTAPVH